jgi:monoamine oxidase
LFRKLQWVERVSEEAARRGPPVDEAVDLGRRRRLWSPSRREILAGTGAAIATAAFAPKAAFAAAVKGDPRVAVVGAGLAGLGCIDTLRAKGVPATSFEASSRVGGRCWSMGGDFTGPVDFEGQVVERGGELIDTLHTTMRSWAREFSLRTELARSVERRSSTRTASCGTRRRS